MTARELAEILLQVPDAVVFVPVPEYSANEPASSCEIQDLFKEKSTGRLVEKSVFTVEVDTSRFELIGKAVVIAGDS